MKEEVLETDRKSHKETLFFGGVTITVKYAEQDDRHTSEKLKRSLYAYGFSEKNIKVEFFIKYDIIIL